MSMYNTRSSYPNRVDDLLFLSDVDCKSEYIMKQHQEYIDKGMYTDASNYIKEQMNTVDITPIVADLFNLLENRIIALQTFVLEQERVNRAYSEEPSNPSENSIWII